jgi:putative DNA methylase
MRDEAEKRIGHLYPKATLPDGSQAPVIAWIWARTVRCPNPACGVRMPLARSWWLGKKKSKECYIVPRMADGEVTFSIGHDIKHAPTKDNDGTVKRTGAVCVGCGSAVPLAYIRAEGKAKRIGTQLMAIVAEGHRRRIYLPPNDKHEQAANIARPDGVPDTELPKQALGFRVQGYGMTQHADLFTNRQLVALTTFADLVLDAREQVSKDAEIVERLSDNDVRQYANVVATYLAFLVGKIADRNSEICTWDSSPSKETPRSTFARQAIPMTWDIAEGNIFGAASGNFDDNVEFVARVVKRLGAGRAGHARQRDAMVDPELAGVVCTDPPYYDNVGYADLADFFYIWLRRCLVEVYPELFGTMLTPKASELVADPARHGKGAEQFFENGFVQTFTVMRAKHVLHLPMAVFYAFKQTESDAKSGEVASTGWEKLLEGLLQAGWSITSTWPMRTELGNRMRSLKSNALASSIVLSCRPRQSDAGSIDRRGYLGALRVELPTALKKLQQGSIAPVDLAQAAIGPGMAVFSRYGQVIEPDGSPMRVRTALTLINQVLAEVISEQEGDFDVDTRWCLKWFELYGFDDGVYGRAETLASAYNVSIAGLERAGVLSSRAGKVTLFSPADLPDDYDPDRDDRISAWEFVLHLAKRLDEKGVGAAAAFMQAAADRVDADTTKELCYSTGWPRRGRTW